MTTKVSPTSVVKIYMSGPLEVAKQILRREVLLSRGPAPEFRPGLCVTIEPAYYIYTGGEETGFIIELLNYPRFHSSESDLIIRARELMLILLAETYQHSALLVTKNTSEWVSIREENK